MHEIIRRRCYVGYQPRSMEDTMSKGKRLPAVVLACLLFLTVTPAAAKEWTPVTGKDAIGQLMSGLQAERTLPGGEVHRGEYLPDGTGMLYAWGAEIPRTWAVKGSNQICVKAKGRSICYQLERNSSNPNLFRARDVATGKVAEFEVTEGGRTIVKAAPGEAGTAGGAAIPSADELAAELSNPNWDCFPIISGMLPVPGMRTLA